MFLLQMLRFRCTLHTRPVSAGSLLQPSLGEAVSKDKDLEKLKAGEKERTPGRKRNEEQDDAD